MIEFFRSIIIGGVQGISEFLPISSSGHLVLIPYVFKWDYQGLTYDVALHFGTAIAILAYFWKDWIKIIKNAFTKNNNIKSDYPKNFLWQIVVATIPAAIAGYLLSDIVEEKFHSPLLIAINLIVFGIILWLTDKYSKKKLQSENLNYFQSFLIGCAQCVALVPGVSRSGITITASRGLGLNREKAARFSFLLATPAMLGAFILKAKDLTLYDIDLNFILGVAASAFFGFIAIKYLLKYLKKSNFAVFLWYRVLIAVLVVIMYFSRAF